MERKRKSYLGQATLVIIGGGVAVGCAVWFIGAVGIVLLTAVLAVLVCYLMIRELNDDFQTLCVARILNRRQNKIGEIRFDYGRGAELKEYDVESVIGHYQGRDCMQIMFGRGYALEEDVFYNLIHAKFFSIKPTVFDGAILVIDNCDAIDEGRGKVEILQHKVIVSGELANVIKRNGADKKLAEILQMFGGCKAEAVAKYGKMYIFISAKKKIFYQFSLLKPVLETAFVGRIERIDKYIGEFIAVLGIKKS